MAHAAGAPPGSAGQPYAAARTFWRAADAVRPAWFICAPLDGADVTVAGLPDGQGRISLAQPLSKGPPDSYRLGEPDPGAGQVYWPLSSGGRRVGELHAFNPGMIDNPRDATTPTFTSIRIAGAQWNCRWLARTRIAGFSARRAFVVTQMAGGGFEYRSFDFKDAAKARRIEDQGADQTNTPSLDIKGGRATAEGFEFRRGGFIYQVIASPAGGAIRVVDNGRTSVREPLIAWTIAPAP